MKMKSWLVLFVSLVPFSALGQNVRVYCKPDGVVFERRGDGVAFTDKNKALAFPYIVIRENEIPLYKYSQQLRCRNRKLVVDSSIKTPDILRKEKIEKKEEALDNELGKKKPDLITVIRLKREVELLRKGDSQ